jgi:hypothetical protein
MNEAELVGHLVIFVFVEIPDTGFHPASSRRVTLARIPCEYGKRHITLEAFKKANLAIKLWMEADWYYKSHV